MATSGSTNYNETRSSIIARALRIVGAASRGKVISAEATAEASAALNALVKSLTNENIYLHSREWLTQTLTASSSVVGTTAGTYYKCIRSHTSSSATRPITGANWESYWEATSTVTATAWATSTAYTSQSEFAMPTGYFEILQASYREDGDSLDFPIEIISYQEYLDIVDKTTQSTVPTKLAVNGDYPTQQIHLWPFPTDTAIIINLLATRSLEDFDANGDEPDFPVRFANVLIYGLADALADEYHIPIEERRIISGKYKYHLEMSRKQDRERDTNRVKSAFCMVR